MGVLGIRGVLLDWESWPFLGGVFLDGIGFVAVMGKEGTKCQSKKRESDC